MIKHTPSTVAVFQTDNFKAFSMINGNRALNLKKIDRIIKEIQGGNDLLKYCPVLVRVNCDKMEIIDGQHRYFVAKKLKRQVHYIIVSEEKKLVDIARLNSNTENWKGQDYINCYINTGNQNYIRLQEFIDKYKINVGSSITMLTTGHIASGGRSELLVKFQEGTFEVKSWPQAVKLAETAKSFSVFKYWNTRNFIAAVKKIIDAGMVPIEDVVEAVNKNPDMLTQKTSPKEYLFCLEQIVNKNKHKRIVIN